MAKFFVTISLVVIAQVISIDFVNALLSVRQSEWDNYKETYQKTYNSRFQESLARINYASNRNMITLHNALYGAGFETYSLALNQFSDMSFSEISALFPMAISLTNSNDKPPPGLQPAADFYDPRARGLKSNIENQGTKCSSGWAYAAAKSLELFKAYQLNDTNPASLSAQTFIDCAGSTTSCKSQVPQTAFDYLTQHRKSLHLESDYKNKNNASEPGMCTPPTDSMKAASLKAYTKIKNGDDESLKSIVSSGFPVVVEYNPVSFHFMHYSDGIFQERRAWRPKRSHFMVVLGYGTDNATKTDYWLLQNSFGTTWGKKGLLQLKRSSDKKIAKNAIFPSLL